MNRFEKRKNIQKNIKEIVAPSPTLRLKRSVGRFFSDGKEKLSEGAKFKKKIFFQKNLFFKFCALSPFSRRELIHKPYL
jgi:hypothetical protein